MISLVCSGVQMFGSTVKGSFSIDAAVMSSRSCGVRMRSGIGREPDVGVESDLMAGVAGDHRTAARLRHVADEEAGPAVERPRVARQPLEIVEQARMSPIAVAREPHHLPVGAVDRKRDAAGKTASWRRSRWRGRREAPAPARRRTAFWPAVLSARPASSRSSWPRRQVGVLIAALTAGLICSAETAPQISNSARQSASLCIDLAPFPSRAPETYHK